MTSPTERAVRARTEIELPDLAWELLPQGAIILTAAEADQVRLALYIGPIPDAAHERDQLDAAHDLLSPALSVDSRPE